MTGFPPWQMSEEEAEAIAKPGARILSRYKGIQGAIREVADPLALVVAVGLPTVVRWRMFVAWKAMNKPTIAAPPPQEQVQREEPPKNGSVADNSATLEHLRNTL